MTNMSRIKQIERQSQEGTTGAKRKEFDHEYRQLLERVFDEIYTEVCNYQDHNKREITCKAGCAACCSQFVSVNVSHAVLVTDYLYANTKAMSVFLNGYDRWLQRFTKHSKAASILHNLEEYTSCAAAMKRYPQELCVSYHKLDIPCPFLDRGQCSIRDVRPIVCAAYFSISPIEHCRADSSIQPLVLEVTPTRENLQRMADLSDPRLYMHQEPLPKLVFKTITQGLPEVGHDVECLFNSNF